MCGGIFSSPSVPPAPTPVEATAEVARSAAEAEAKQRQQIAASQGRRSLTDPGTGATGVENTKLAENGKLFG